MGVQGLLPALGISAEKATDVTAELQRGVVAFDGMVQVHKSFSVFADTVAKQQIDDKKVTDDTYAAIANHFMSKVNTYRLAGVQPHYVFDGRRLKEGKLVDNDRAEKVVKARQEIATKREKQEEVTKNKWRSAAELDNRVLHAIILRLKDENVDYTVAPYEADPQLAYMARTGLAHTVVTEDADLLLYNIPRVVYKLRIADAAVIPGTANAVRIPKLYGVIVTPADVFTRSTKYNFDGWDIEILRYFAIVNGCDYVKKLRGIGMGTLHAAVSEACRAWGREGRPVAAGVVFTDLLQHIQRVRKGKRGKEKPVKSTENKQGGDERAGRVEIGRKGGEAVEEEVEWWDLEYEHGTYENGAEVMRL